MKEQMKGVSGDVDQEEKCQGIKWLKERGRKKGRGDGGGRRARMAVVIVFDVVLDKRESLEILV